MKGRKPKPTATKILRGNPGRKKLNLSEPKTKGIPYCPRYLEAEARAEWNRIIPIMRNMGILSGSDRATIAAYCQAYGRWVKYSKIVQEKGELYQTKTGNVTTSPAMWILNKALDQMRRFAVELGLTPSARSRVVVAPEDTRSEIERYMDEVVKSV